jgi:hypothetical protein
MTNKALTSAAALAAVMTMLPGLAGAETRLSGLDTLNVPACISVNAEELGRKADLRGRTDTRAYCKSEDDRIVVQVLPGDAAKGTVATTVAIPLSVFNAPKPIAVTVLPK